MDAVAWSIARTVYPILAGVAVVGVCLNSLLLLTTIFTKSLRSTSNILIGCCALFDVMHATGYFIQFPILFSDYYIDSYYCSIMQFIPALGRAGGAVCVLCIGVDRMLVLLIAFNYQNINRLYFLLGHFLTIALFWGWTVYLMIAYWSHKQQICSMPAPFHGDSLGLWTYSVTGVNVVSALVYFITWQTVKRRQISTHHKKIFQSIAIVMIVEVTGWFISSILIDLSKIYVVPERRPPFHYIACLFVNSGIAVKALVYYAICAEYRKSIRLFLGMKKSTVLSSTTSRTQPNTSRAEEVNPASISLGPMKGDHSTQNE